MAEIAERYRRLSDAFAATVAAVPDDRWTSPSPCEDWSAREVVAHLVETQGMFLGFIGRRAPADTAVADDPAAAWDSARAAVQAVLDDPATAAETFEGFTGTTTFEAAVDRFLCTDLVVHRWDLAEATGQEVTLEPADMAAVREAMTPMGDALRSAGAFGPELAPPPGADQQTAFLAWTGRRA